MNNVSLVIFILLTWLLFSCDKQDDSVALDDNSDQDDSDEELISSTYRDVKGFWFAADGQGLHIINDSTVHFLAAFTENLFYNYWSISSHLYASDTSEHFFYYDCLEDESEQVVLINVVDSLTMESIVLDQNPPTEKRTWKRANPPHIKQAFDIVDEGQNDIFTYEVINDGALTHLVGQYDFDSSIKTGFACQTVDTEGSTVISASYFKLNSYCHAGFTIHLFGFYIKELEERTYAMNGETENFFDIYETKYYDGGYSPISNGELTIDNLKFDNILEFEFRGWFLVGDQDTLFIRNGFLSTSSCSAN